MEAYFKRDNDMAPIWSIMPVLHNKEKHAKLSNPQEIVNDLILAWKMKLLSSQKGFISMALL